MLFLPSASELSLELLNPPGSNSSLYPTNLLSGSDQYKALSQSPWNNSNLIERLVELGCLGDPQHDPVPSLAKDVLSLGCQQAPETLLLGFSKLSSWPSTSPSATNALKDLLNSLLLAFLQGGGAHHHPSGGASSNAAAQSGGNTSLVLPLLWQNSPSLFVTGCIYLYNSDPSCLSRVLDLAQEIKVLLVLFFPLTQGPRPAFLSTHVTHLFPYPMKPDRSCLKFWKQSLLRSR